MLLKNLMDLFFGIDSPAMMMFAMAIGMFAGLIKGIVGFALPMVTISGLGMITSAEVALAGMILPTLATNGWQALRQGPYAAWQSICRFRQFLSIGFVALMLSAQLVPIIPDDTLFLVIGASVTFFVLLQIAGLQLRLPARSRRKSETVFGVAAGVLSGISGIWGPPTVAMLTALNTEKSEQMRVQGVVYGLGSVALVGAHFASGVLRAETAPLSMALILPSVLGMAIGFQIQDRIDQTTFRKATLAVLLLGGLNLIRRSLM